MPPNYANPHACYAIYVDMIKSARTSHQREPQFDGEFRLRRLKIENTDPRLNSEKKQPEPRSISAHDLSLLAQKAVERGMHPTSENLTTVINNNGSSLYPLNPTTIRTFILCYNSYANK